MPFHHVRKHYKSKGHAEETSNAKEDKKTKNQSDSQLHDIYRFEKIGSVLRPADDSKTEEKQTFEKALEELINKHSQENGSDTPDFILARLMCECLEAFNRATKERDKWYDDLNAPTDI